MSYGTNHTENHCDKCCRLVGKENLSPMPFFYLDINDKTHKDLGQGYHQYWVCKKCLKKC